MLVAIDSGGKRYLSTERDVAHKERFYVCQECKQNVFLRIYTDRLSHFAHYPDSKECAGPWESDSELHMTMKKDIYDYFKNFPWVQTIEIEYPIDIGKERLISDIFITTQNGENINIECQATVYDMYHMLKRVEKFSSIGIHTLYIFEIENFGNRILNWNEDVYISSTININKDVDKDIKDAESLYIHRFYLYNSDLALREKYSNIIFSVDRVYGRDPYPMISSVYINSVKFDEYRLGTIDNKYSIMMDTAPYKKEKIEEAQKLFEEELKRKEEQRKVREEEIKKQEEERKKLDDDLKKKREEMLRLAKERDLKANINKGDTTWSLYMDVPGTDKPVLLSPLRWKGSDQVSNLITMAKFFETIDASKADFTKILLYLSVCGSGKSATLLHEIRAMGRGIIVTPFKNLQRQYSEDYFKGNKFVSKRNGKKLSVTVIVGRNNFKCRWLQEQYDLQQKIIDIGNRPENADSFAPVDDDILKTYHYDQSCANRRLPCTTPLRYIGKGRRESRLSVACKCPYWIPTPMPKEIIDSWAKASVTGDDIEENFDDSSEHDIENNSDNEDVIKKPTVNTRLDDIKEKVHCSNIEYYNSVGWGEVGVFIRDVGPNIHPVCPYYEQFYSYARSDAIVMNSAKWDLETRMGRKPQVDIEIMDEGDYWLDSLTTTIEIPRSSIDKIITGDSNIKKLKSDALALFDMSFRHIKARLDEQSKAKATNINIIDAVNYREAFQSILTLLREYAQETDDDERIEQKLVDLNTILRYSDRASVSIRQGAREETKILKVYIPYPDMLLAELLRSSSKNIIITSGTLHEKPVLNNLFGINANNYIVSILTGRKDQPGKLKCVRPQEGLPVVNYTSWQSDQFKAYYCKVLTYIIDNMKILVDKATGKHGGAKILILTPSKKYANCIINRPDVHVDFAKGNPDEENVKINTTLSDYVDNVLADVKKIKGEDINIDGDVLRTDKQIIVSTRMIRGTDLRDDKCRGLIILKWPMSDISDGYNQALKKRFGDNIFWIIMKDKAARDAVQMVSRGLRHDLDWEYFSSPDRTAFDNVIKLFST